MRRSFSPQLDVLDSRIAPSNVSLSGAISGTFVKTPEPYQAHVYYLNGSGDGYISGLGQVHETVNLQEIDSGCRPIYQGTITLSNSAGSITFGMEGTDQMSYYGSLNAQGAFAGDSVSGVMNFEAFSTAADTPVAYSNQFLYSF